MRDEGLGCGESSNSFPFTDPVVFSISSMYFTFLNVRETPRPDEEQTDGVGDGALRAGGCAPNDDVAAEDIEDEAFSVLGLFFAMVLFFM